MISNGFVSAPMVKLRGHVVRLKTKRTQIAAYQKAKAQSLSQSERATTARKKKGLGQRKTGGSKH